MLHAFCVSPTLIFKKLENVLAYEIYFPLKLEHIDWYFHKLIKGIIILQWDFFSLRQYGQQQLYLSAFDNFYFPKAGNLHRRYVNSLECKLNSEDTKNSTYSNEDRFCTMVHNV